MFGRALSWGSAFAVCIVHCSLVYQFEHSGKVRRAWFKFGFKNFYSSLLSGSASFLCAALTSPQRTKQYCPQIEYIYIYIYTCVPTNAQERFRILAQARSSYHLDILEAMYIRSLEPSLCAQKEFVKSLTLFT